MSEKGFIKKLLEGAGLATGGSKLYDQIQKIGYRVVRSERLEARIKNMADLHTFIMEEPQGENPEEQLEYVKKKVEITDLTIKRVAVVYLRAGDNKATAKFIDNYAILMSRIREYVSVCDDLLKMRGTSELKPQTDTENDFNLHKNKVIKKLENGRPSYLGPSGEFRRYIDKGILVQILHKFFLRDIEPIITLLQAISFKNQDIDTDWVFTHIGKPEKEYQDTTIKHPRDMDDKPPKQVWP